MQTQTISKSAFKPKALKYFREVEKKNKSFVITHAGKPVAKVVPYSDKENDEKILEELRDSVKSYKFPTKPVGLSDWEVLK